MSFELEEGEVWILRVPEGVHDAYTSIVKPLIIFFNSLFVDQPGPIEPFAVE